jgi:hypothetical protein
MMMKNRPMKISAALSAAALCVVFVLAGGVVKVPSVRAGDVAATRRHAAESAAPKSSQAGASAPQVLFDDFAYRDRRALTRHGWIVRSAPGWPGVPGATWWQEGVTFLKDEAAPRNRILRMTSSTDGTGANTRQTQICHERKYFEGTYAARVRFTDAPLKGPGGDQIVESFYTISPLKAPMDADYSELDFEYLPNGGWGVEGPTLYETTWYTFSPEPNWKKDNTFNMTKGSRAGWHTLVTQVAGGRVRYFVDGAEQVEHTGRYYPRSFMSINFNLWFIKDGAAHVQGARSYNEDIDWVFFEAESALTPEEVESRVAALRRRRVSFRDTVTATIPSLASPCNF